MILPLQAAADMVGESAPEFSARDLTGAVVSLSHLSYKTVMLFHFNVYCHTCREEVPLINTIQRNNKDLTVIGIAIGNDAKEVIEFQQTFKPEFTLIPDPKQELYKTFYVYSVPLVDIIDTSGTIRYRGKISDYQAFQATMHAIMQDKSLVGAGLWNKAPDFTLTGTTGDTFRLYDTIGQKQTLLTFMSVHNQTVHQVVEIMKSLYNQYTREDLNIIRIAVRDSPEAVEQFRQKYHITFPLLLDTDGKVAALYGVKAIPKSFIINKKGAIRYISDQLSLANLMPILTKLKSYFREELPEEELMKYIHAAAPGVPKFNKIILDNNMPVYIGAAAGGEKILVREVFKDVLCDVCTNVHFVYAFDQTGKIKNIVLIESLDLYGVPIDANHFLQDLIKLAGTKLPLTLRKDVDALTGATQSCKLIIEGLNETLPIVNSLNKFRDMLVQIPEE
jgi:peroxiredoxin